jgi:hypothetical protein
MKVILSVSAGTLDPKDRVDVLKSLDVELKAVIKEVEGLFQKDFDSVTAKDVKIFDKATTFSADLQFKLKLGSDRYTVRIHLGGKLDENASVRTAKVQEAMVTRNGKGSPTISWPLSKLSPALIARAVKNSIFKLQ